MFKITEEAETYVSDLFSQQDEKEIGLRVDIEKAGTPAAAVTFNFCFPKDLSRSYQKFEYKGFFCFIDEANFGYLEDSDVALKDNGSGKSLTITAPKAKGSKPTADDSLEDRIKYVLAADISPGLASHGGFVDLIEITEDMDVILNFGGGCQGCSGVKVTLKNGVEVQLKQSFPEIRSVMDQTDHSQKENAYM